jgi:LacI family transcriptional regulator
VLYGEWSEQWGREAARIMLQSTPDVDGFFCGNDQIARGVSEALRQLGRTIPDDVAPVGFDNWEPVVLGADPPLTSVDMCLEDIGRKAAELLLAAISGEPAFWCLHASLPACHEGLLGAGKTIW